MIWNRETHKVLIVPGSRSDNGLRAKFLLRSGIRIVAHEGHVEALQAARKEQPSLIVVELNGDGAERVRLCRRLEDDAVTRAIPLLVVVCETMADQARSLSADGMLRSPLVASDYFEAASRFLPLPRRRDVRHPINIRFTFRHGDIQAQAFSRNLSTYGAFLKTDLVVEPGTRISVRFLLPGETSDICCGAVVHRAAPFDANPSHWGGFAVEFADLAAADRDRLRGFIDRRSGRRVAAR